MKITDVRTALLGDTLVVRVTTDEGICGYGCVERTREFVRPLFDILAPYVIGENPTEVERTMLKIRRLGAFKPWGKAVSAIEVALWDLAGKAAGLPIHRLLGGKVRDRVRVYNGGKNYPGDTLAEQIANLKAGPEGFTMIKGGSAFHGGMSKVPNFTYSEPRDGWAYSTRGPLTEWALKDTINRVAELKELLGDDIGLALDCGPGWTLPDAIKFAKAVEPYNLLWLEDLLTGDYTPYINPRQYRELTASTTTPIHTGEQIYLRQNFVELLSTNAVRVIGPDPLDVGGLAELKWVAELADVYGVLIAPHGTLDGLIGLAALVQVSATLPDNYLAFEYPVGRPDWWYDIITGLPDPIVKDGFIEVWDAPGLGIDFNVDEAKRYLSEQDQGFFD
ncbi:mandelate racemase/muconate lactonizing enzyme family protein [Rugosimonospora acidiphila]|uniref:Mandelate racemase/muconate lactonizing enzyme family protein n=1 Tax=Rugosimonospora acidiphila TaxID=556531 RepID=A0ABP9SN57_9ACTN